MPLVKNFEAFSCPLAHHNFDLPDDADRMHVQ